MAGDFHKIIHLRATGGRNRLRGLVEARTFILNELPAELRRLPRWSFAEALVGHAQKTGKQRDLRAAERQLRQALSNEGWLAETPPPEKADAERVIDCAK